MAPSVGNEQKASSFSVNDSVFVQICLFLLKFIIPMASAVQDYFTAEILASFAVKTAQTTPKWLFLYQHAVWANYVGVLAFFHKTDNTIEFGTTKRGGRQNFSPNGPGTLPHAPTKVRPLSATLPRACTRQAASASTRVTRHTQAPCFFCSLPRVRLWRCHVIPRQGGAIRVPPPGELGAARHVFG